MSPSPSLGARPTVATVGRRRSSDAVSSLEGLASRTRRQPSAVTPFPRPDTAQTRSDSRFGHAHLRHLVDGTHPTGRPWTPRSRAGHGHCNGPVRLIAVNTAGTHTRSCDNGRPTCPTRTVSRCPSHPQRVRGMECSVGVRCSERLTGSLPPCSIVTHKPPRASRTRCAIGSQRRTGPRVLETLATTRRGPGRLKPGDPHPTAWP